MKHVLRALYVHASQSLDSIWGFIHTSDGPREAVFPLSDFHRKSTQEDRLGTIEPEDVEALSRMQFVTFKNPLTEGEALTSLFLVSFFAFSGGKGQWQTFLDATCTYALSILRDLRWGGPTRVLIRCPESLRFIVKTSIWFDVLASITLIREPRLLGVIRELFRPQPCFFDDEPIIPMAEYSMMDVMGCENHVILAVAEIASWRETHSVSGSLSVTELVRRSYRIGEILKKPSSGTQTSTSISLRSSVHCSAG